ncbi:Meiosis-specific serine/threonine-protein kinase mek1 [Cytospora mali]|uniref:Meiosis-specific serine/threonine-protein kinase mek1 n=1 Tax=Cytospora mali TaxID=578113 RepID=A0A194V650_CYTMA|nr:Meiosis-specific serine/threonine-protein kinase mek1 [Valsa mali var. pyri (nom. inval.)]
MAPNNVDQAVSAEPVAEIKVEITDTWGGPSEYHTIHLFPNKTVRVGRDSSSFLTFDSEFPLHELAVSRNHLEFYSVVIEEDCDHHPLVYVRDRQSHMGIGVNDEHIKDTKSITPARLLHHGDKVTIPPHVTFELVQPFTPKLKLSPFQSEEVKLFGDRFIVMDRTLGNGTSAQVHLAIDRQTGEQLACKVYDMCKLENTGNSDMVRRLMQETFVRCQMDHPNIAAFRGAYKSHSTLYVFEELATGGDLFSLLVRDNHFTESDVRWMVRQVVQGIAYMHEKGVVHRDLKLENILCAICPKPGHRLVVTDFGHSGVIGLERMNVIVGTTGWQAPELLKPPHLHGIPVDIWAIGVLATQLLAGASKMEAMDLLDAFARSPCDTKEPAHELDKLFKELFTIRSDPISEDAKDFIHRCFHVNPQTRITAAEALQHPWLCKPDDDLKKFLQREKETTANWKRRQVLRYAVKHLPDLRQQTADGSPYFTHKQRKPNLHAIRRTAEYKKRQAAEKNKRKRLLMQDDSVLSSNRGLEERSKQKSKEPTRRSQRLLAKASIESGKSSTTQLAESQDEEGDQDWDDRPSKRVKA